MTSYVSFSLVRKVAHVKGEPGVDKNVSAAAAAVVVLAAVAVVGAAAAVVVVTAAVGHSILETTPGTIEVVTAVGAAADSAPAGLETVSVAPISCTH